MSPKLMLDILNFQRRGESPKAFCINYTYHEGVMSEAKQVSTYFNKKEESPPK